MTPKPVNPYLVLAVAVVLPGCGQVLNKHPLRGLMFVFFILLLGAFTLKTAAAEVSIIGKLAGGIFVYAMSVLDAYHHSRVRFETWRHGKDQLG
jgi:urea transporter